MQVSLDSLLIGGKCRGRYCSQPLYRGGYCRNHYARRKLRDAAELVGAARPTTYFVYAISAPNGLVKIGVSSEPERRFSTLRSSSPMSLELLGYIPASQKIEQLLHRALVSARSHGEWFRPTEEVTSAVKAICTKDWDLLEKVLGLEESAAGG